MVASYVAITDLKVRPSSRPAPLCDTVPPFAVFSPSTELFRARDGKGGGRHSSSMHWNLSNCDIISFISQ